MLNAGMLPLTLICCFQSSSDAAESQRTVDDVLEECLDRLVCPPITPSSSACQLQKKKQKNRETIWKSPKICKARRNRPSREALGVEAEVKIKEISSCFFVFFCEARVWAKKALLSCIQCGKSLDKASFVCLRNMRQDYLVC